MCWFSLITDMGDFNTNPSTCFVNNELIVGYRTRINNNCNMNLSPLGQAVNNSLQQGIFAKMFIVAYLHEYIGTICIMCFLP